MKCANCGLERNHHGDSYSFHYGAEKLNGNHGSTTPKKEVNILGSSNAWICHDCVHSRKRKESTTSLKSGLVIILIGIALIATINFWAPLLYNIGHAILVLFFVFGLGVALAGYGLYTRFFVSRDATRKIGEEFAIELNKSRIQNEFGNKALLFYTTDSFRQLK